MLVDNFTGLKRGVWAGRIRILTTPEELRAIADVLEKLERERTDSQAYPFFAPGTKKRE